MERSSVSTKSKAGSSSDRRSSFTRHKQDSRDTDKHIFALGDAASKLDDINLDDLFARFNEFNVLEGSYGEAGNVNEVPGLQKREYNQTTEAEARLHATVIEGPEYCAKTVEITHNTDQILPNGPVVTGGRNNKETRITSSLVNNSKQLQPQVGGDTNYGQYLDARNQAAYLKRISGTFVCCCFFV